MSARTRIALAAVVAALSLAVAVAPASAVRPVNEATFNALEAVCTSQGGDYFFSGPGAAAACTGEFSDAQLRAPRAVCESYRKFGPVFYPVSIGSEPGWLCSFGNE